MKQLNALAIAALMTAITAIGCFSLFYLLSKSALELDQVHKARYESQQLATELRLSSDDLTRLARTYTVTGDAEYEKQYNAVLDVRNGKATRPTKLGRIYWDFVAAGKLPMPEMKPSKPLMDMMKDAGFSDAEFKALEQAGKNSDGLVKLEVKAMNAVKGRFADDSGGYAKVGDPDMEMARGLLHGKEYHQFKAQIVQYIDEFFDLLDKRTSAAVDQKFEELNRDKFWFAVLALVLMVELVTLMMLSKAQVTQQLGGTPAEVEEELKSVAAGKLTASPKEKLNGAMLQIESMKKVLRESMKSVQDLANDVTKESMAVQTAAKSVEVRSETQSQSASSMAAGVEQLSVSISTVAQNGLESNDMAQQGSASAHKASEVVLEMVESIGRMDQLAKQASGSIQTLADQSKTISNVIQTIEAVAGQTNLLALNAAIEAARAGESGRGFAVVADEVRKLAESTKSSTLEISRTIQSMQSSAMDAVEQAKMVEQVAQEDAEKAAFVKNAIAEVQSASALSSELSAAIAHQVAEQQSASQHIAQGVEIMAREAGENSTLALSSVETSNRLGQLAQRLKIAVDVYQV